MKPIQSTDEDSSGKIFEEKPEKTLGEVIQDDLSMFIADMRQALDNCFNVIYDDAWHYIPDEDKNQINVAKAIYDKHFASR